MASEVSLAFDAVRKNDLGRLQYLFDTYLDVDWFKYQLPNAGDSFVHIAARLGHIDILRFLFKKLESANYNLSSALSQKNLDGKTGLHEAAQASQSCVVKLLLDTGGDVNALKRADWTPLMLACTKTGAEALKTVAVLCSHKHCDPTIKNKDGWTALHVAVREGDPNIVQLLLNLNSFPRLHTASNNGRFPIHVAALHGHKEVVKQLLNNESCPVNALDACGVSPFLDAVHGNHIELVELLVKANANIFQKDRMGLGCVHLAAQHGYIEMLSYLINTLGIDVNWISDGEKMTALHCAARTENLLTINHLLKLGADPLIRNARGKTAIDCTSCSKIWDKFEL